MRLAKVLGIGVLSLTALTLHGVPAAAQTVARSTAPGAATPAVTPPPGYIIGPDDVLEVTFWRDKDMSAEVVVRPDGKIALPLLNDMQAAGLTPEQLRVSLAEAATKYVEDPTASVVVKRINSLRVFITGMVSKPGAYSLTGAGTTVLQVISMAGGLMEYAHKKDISIVRIENGRPTAYRFNYQDVTKRKNLKQNIDLKPGDTVVVP
jgi:polysaccharide export outer membrane protein